MLMLLGGMLSIGGCADDGPQDEVSGRLSWPHEPGAWAGVATDDVDPGDPVTLGALVLCVEGADEGTVVGVRTPEGSRVVVTDFTLRPQDALEMFGGDRVALADTGIPVGGRVVDTSCGEELGTELVVEVTYEGPGSANASTLVVDYLVDGEPGSVPIGFGIGLCPPGAETCTVDDS